MASSKHPALRTVVVPVDGSAESIRPVAFATRLADRAGADLVVLSIVGDFRSEAPTRVARIDELLHDLPDHVERRVVQADGVTATIAEESEGGLVCIATSAEPFDGEGIRHSVTDSLVAAARCPVIAFGPHCSDEHCSDDVDVDRIVVAVDPAHDQVGLSAWATRLGYQLGVPVEFVHVDGTGRSELGPKVREIAANNRTIAERLIDEAAGGLLAMGSHGRTGFRRLAEGSVGAALLPAASMPLMLLGPGAEAQPG